MATHFDIIDDDVSYCMVQQPLSTSSSIVVYLSDVTNVYPCFKTPPFDCSTRIALLFGREEASNETIDLSLERLCAGKECMACVDLTVRGISAFVRVFPRISLVAAGIRILGVHSELIRESMRWHPNSRKRLRKMNIPMNSAEQQAMRELFSLHTWLPSVLGPEAAELFCDGQQMRFASFMLQREYQSLHSRPPSPRIGLTADGSIAPPST